MPVPLSLDGIVFGRPTVAGSRWFEEGAEDAVAHAFDAAVAALESAGATIKEVALDEYGIDPEERTVLFPATVGPELVSAFGAERFVAAQPLMDTKTAERAGNGLNVSAVEHAAALRRIRELAVLGELAFAGCGCDAWLTPTVLMTAGTVAELDTEEGAPRGALCSRNTQPGNLLGQCSVTLPLATEVGLPAGLQVRSMVVLFRF